VVPELTGEPDAAVMSAAGSGAGTAEFERAASAAAVPYVGAFGDFPGNTVHLGRGAEVYDIGEIAEFERE
jgi:hypothetical protein